MRQLLRILLLSFSISAVESGILYLLIKQEEKKEPKIFLTDPQVSQTGDAINSSFASRQAKRKIVPYLNGYRHHVNSEQQTNMPRSDGRVYRR
jgi:hypothetical protein